jgi:hypothetical protein
VYLPVPSQPDCASAWLAAVRAVDAQQHHTAHNVIIDLANPVARSTLVDPVVRRVNDFLVARDKSVECIANTIFPQSLYRRYGHPNFIKAFHERILPKVRTNSRWSGYYFERMTEMPRPQGGLPIDQLSRMIDRIKDPNNTSLNKYEISIFDPSRDVTGSPYGGQCLSFMSFHLLSGVTRTLVLTAQYRNHYYVEKLLGNLIGLGRLMAFVANETGCNVGPLTVVSTNAEIDLPKATRQEFVKLLADCDATATPNMSAA